MNEKRGEKKIIKSQRKPQLSLFHQNSEKCPLFEEKVPP